MQVGGAGLLNKYSGSLSRALQSAYPSYPWHSYRFTSPHYLPNGTSPCSKNQYLLYQHVRTVSTGTYLAGYPVDIPWCSSDIQSQASEGRKEPH